MDAKCLVPQQPHRAKHLRTKVEGREPNSSSGSSSAALLAPLMREHETLQSATWAWMRSRTSLEHSRRVGCDESFSAPVFPLGRFSSESSTSVTISKNGSESGSRKVRVSDGSGSG